MADARCRSCAEPILWVRTAAKGKLIPLDVEPHPEGNVELNDAGKAIVHPQAPLAGTLYRSHFVTCPNADEWRKK